MNQMAEKNFGVQSVDCAFAIVESSRIQAQQHNYSIAIEELETAISI